MHNVVCVCADTAILYAYGGDLIISISYFVFLSPLFAHPPLYSLTCAAYMKKGEGMGGTSNHTAAVEAAAAIAKRGAVAAPPKANATLKRPNPPNSALRMHYERGDLPLALTQGHKSHIRWAVDVSKLDYHHYLPIFASGLREVEEPFRTIAEDGFSDMVTAPGAAEKVFPVVSQLIIPLKEALSTRDERILVRVCRALGKLAVLGGGVAPALVPYFRQLLPVLNIYVGRAVNIGDAMDFAQRKGNIGELIQDTLQKLEIHGGPDAYINIK